MIDCLNSKTKIPKISKGVECPNPQDNPTQRPLKTLLKSLAIVDTATT